MEEKQLSKGVGDEVYIELIPCVKEIFILLIEKICSKNQIAS